MIYHEFSNKNQLIWILNAKDMMKSILLSLLIRNMLLFIAKFSRIEVKLKFLL